MRAASSSHYPDVCCPGKKCFCFEAFLMNFSDPAQGVDALRVMKAKAALLKRESRGPLPRPPPRCPPPAVYPPSLPDEPSPSLTRPPSPLQPENQEIELIEEPSQSPPLSPKAPTTEIFIPRVEKLHRSANFLPAIANDITCLFLTINRKGKKGFGSGKGRTHSYTEYVTQVINNHHFCVGMIRKLVGCSRRFLYSRRIVPDHLGGKFSKFLLRPEKPPTLPPVKVLRQKNLVEIDTLATTRCCRKRCSFKTETPAMVEYRRRYCEAPSQVEDLLGCCGSLCLGPSSEITFFSSPLKMAQTEILQEVLFSMGKLRGFCYKFVTGLLGCSRGKMTLVKTKRHPFVAIPPHGMTDQM